MSKNRLKSQSDFRLLRRKGTRLTGKSITVDYRFTDRPTRLGITIPKKCGRANVRNRFKRIVREGFRHILPVFPRNLDLNIHPRYSFREATSKDIAHELERLIRGVL